MGIVFLYSTPVQVDSHHYFYISCNQSKLTQDLSDTFADFLDVCYHQIYVRVYNVDDLKSFPGFLIPSSSQSSSQSSIQSSNQSSSQSLCYRSGNLLSSPFCGVGIHFVCIYDCSNTIHGYTPHLPCKGSHIFLNIFQALYRISSLVLCKHDLFLCTLWRSRYRFPYRSDIVNCMCTC
jgi:hypothetical protein